MIKIGEVWPVEMGELLRQARLEAGLTQRELCGERITRNMLSQIENGAAFHGNAAIFGGCPGQARQLFSR